MKVTKKQLAQLTVEAEAGNLKAQVEVADIYRFGWGVSEDAQKAIYWYKKAIEQGAAEALVESEDCFTENLGYEAVEYYRKLAEGGNAAAQLLLASLFGEGKCIPKNDKEALRWRLSAAKQNNGEACYLVGTMFTTGEGTEKNVEEGIKWLLKVADPKTTNSEFDLGSAQFALAEAYADPEYPKRDLVEAYKWLNLLIGYCTKNEDYRVELAEKRDVLASSMTREQVEEAQRRSAELFVPAKLISERIKRELAGVVEE